MSLDLFRIVLICLGAATKPSAMIAREAVWLLAMAVLTETGVINTLGNVVAQSGIQRISQNHHRIKRQSISSHWHLTEHHAQSQLTGFAYFEVQVIFSVSFFVKQ